MPTSRPIKYVAHPVSAEDKAAIIADGYRIIDIRFKPKRKKKATKKS